MFPTVECDLLTDQEIFDLTEAGYCCPHKELLLQLEDRYLKMLGYVNDKAIEKVLKDIQREGPQEHRKQDRRVDDNIQEELVDGK